MVMKEKNMLPNTMWVCSRKLAMVPSELSTQYITDDQTSASLYQKLPEEPSHPPSSYVGSVSWCAQFLFKTHVLS